MEGREKVCDMGGLQELGSVVKGEILREGRLQESSLFTLRD